MLLWTKEGCLIGMFGQMQADLKNDPIPKVWEVGNVETYEEKRARDASEEFKDVPSDWKSEDKSHDFSKTEKTFSLSLDQTFGVIHGHSEKERERRQTIDTIGSLEEELTGEETPAKEWEDGGIPPNLLALLEKPSSLSRPYPSKSKKIPSSLKRQLKTFELDDIPRESPFPSK